MSIVDSVKRAPRWAWVTVAGIGIGATAVKLYRDRDAEPSDEGGEPVEGATVVGSGVGNQSTAAGVIVPPVILGQSGDQGSAVAGMGVWADAVGSVVDVFGGVVSQLVGVTGDIATGHGESLERIALAGSAPQPVQQNPSPVVVNIPAPQPAPQPVYVAPAPAPRTIVKTCGQSYNGESGNCRHRTMFYYSDGTNSGWVNDHKMHDGKCGTVATNCT